MFWSNNIDEYISDDEFDDEMLTMFDKKEKYRVYKYVRLFIQRAGLIKTNESINEPSFLVLLLPFASL